MGAPVKKKEPKDPSWVRHVREALREIPCQYILVAVYGERHEITRVFTSEDNSEADQRALKLGFEAVDFFVRQETRQKVRT